MASVEADVTALKTDVTTLKTDVGEIKAELFALFGIYILVEGYGRYTGPRKTTATIRLPHDKTLGVLDIYISRQAR